MNLRWQRQWYGRTDAPIEENPMSEAPTLDPTRRARLQQMYGSLSDHAMAPLWESLHSLVKPTPRSQTVPAKWDYARVVRPFRPRIGTKKNCVWLR